ncbi:uncharacterized protein LOC132198325 [Neocloeon triangulifer]|uniref:uncharacterized protein LOC132198325 n=1 Tax=Neocloeon triangulifer TaxID=2078957 RepID=UPI00286F2B39|nr:uncharacterized protein LOC132198325 [Neocloeon triangulifer]
MKKAKGRLCLVLLGLLAAINELHAEQIDVLSNGSIWSEELLQQQVQALTTQVDKVADELKALKQQQTAPTITNNTIALTGKLAFNSKVWKTENRIAKLEKKMFTFAKEKTEFAQFLNQKAIKVIDSLKGSGNASVSSQEQLVERQEKLLKLNLSVQCYIADSHSALSRQLPNRKKYFFSYPTQVNWSVADETCRGMNLHLATIRNETDLKVTWAEAKKMKNGTYWWLSAKNFGSGKKSDFRWHDGSKLPRNSTLWRGNDKKHKGCVYFSSGSTEKLNDGLCSLNMYFICELPRECN